MRLAFVDSEPPSATGGGIRTYTRLAGALCRDAGMQVRVYTHNPDAYPGMDARPIGRRAWLPRGLRGLAYRFFPAENVAFENAYWLAEELRLHPCDCAEFPDFQGLAFFAVGAGLKTQVTLRVHTPLYLVYREAGRRGLSFLLLRFREISCMRRAVHLTVPSEEFMREKIPWRGNFRVIPNPPPFIPDSAVPKSPGPPQKPDSRSGTGFRIVCLGRVEPRKGTRILVEAFFDLAEEFPQASLTLIGDSGDAVYGESIVKIPSTRGQAGTRMQWWPAHSGEKSDLLKSFSCLVLPSLWENSPYVFWEGMTAGIPCLGTATGEMKRAGKIIGYPHVIPGDKGSLVSALRSWILAPEKPASLVENQFRYLRDIRAASPNLLKHYARCALPLD